MNWQAVNFLLFVITFTLAALWIYGSKWKQKLIGAVNCVTQLITDLDTMALSWFEGIWRQVEICQNHKLQKSVSISLALLCWFNDVCNCFHLSTNSIDSYMKRISLTACLEQHSLQQKPPEDCGRSENSKLFSIFCPKKFLLPLSQFQLNKFRLIIFPLPFYRYFLFEKFN